ncbi:phenylalanyl-tRNA synthetase subunit beta [alpha proteobacterium AAP81b]|nr:phenylalanyl-tRNA synthetase subunit beta [alpha proteobacterium AAP81b]
MKFTLGWLKEHLDTSASLDEVTATLNRIGLEVEGVEDASAALAPFVIAEVLTAERHPQADKLQVLSVSAGGAAIQVVCGAPNARAGMKGVFGAPGTYVPGSDITLKVAAIRGVESRGMMCSERELQLSEEHNGIIELPADAPVGARYVDWAGLVDPVIDVAITPNRQDCMGVRGIARDLAAAGLGRLKPLAEAYRIAALDVPRAGPGPDVRTDDPGCPAFFACAVTGVTNGASPAWMQQKLKAIGSKPISALVDITNFVMFDLGRPLHVYDRATLSGGLVARKAIAGEQVEALNGRTYALDETMTVIADDAHVHDIGGIMGGKASGCSETTTDVLIECAFFDPDSIARTGQKLTLTSDARSRFERGVDPGFLDDGLAIATHLVLELCGGTASEVTRSGTPPTEPKQVAFRPARVLGLAGIDVAQDEQAAILERLGFGVARGDPWTITVPTWRRDVGSGAAASNGWDGEADIVEEVVRIHGLDAIQSTPLPRAEGVAKPTATPAQALERRVRRATAARGFDEAVTWSFLPPADAEAFGGAAFTLANPISADLAAMRPSLLPGLLAAAKRNADRGQASLRLFEIGQRYLADAEHPTLALLLAGQRLARDWRTGPAVAVDAYDAKAEALAALAIAGAPVDRLAVAAPATSWWHPGRAGRLVLGKVVLADFGMVHPAILKHFDLKQPVAAVELYLDALPPRRRGRAVFAPPALQPLTRDFAFVVPETLAADALVRAASGADKALIAGVKLFDRFAGAGIGEGNVSLAIEVTLQPKDATLTEADIAAVSAKIVAAAEKLGASLRG